MLESWLLLMSRKNMAEQYIHSHDLSLRRKQDARAAVLLFLLTIIIFGDVLISGRRLLSEAGTDISSLYYYWRSFGYRELLRGNLPLWNPHIFCGMTYFGEFQSALLYPPNLLYLILPLTRAINIGIALHVYLLGIFTYFWIRRRDIHYFACLVSSALMMFCGAHFLHIYAGHLSNLCSMIWAPLVLYAIDGLFETKSPRFWFIGVGAIAMQILGGHPQYVFYTALTAGVYALMCFSNNRKSFKSLLWIVGMWLAAAALTAVQLLPGIEASAESVRSSGVSYEFASRFSLPPENLMTLIIPRFFGPVAGGSSTYWGRWYIWETSLFIGAAGFFLALWGAINGDKTKRRYSLAMAIILLILALGSYTPLFKVLYRYLPGFNKFRGTAKFGFFFSLFMTMLAACGLDALLKTRQSHRRAGTIVLAAGLLLLVYSFYLRSPASSGKDGSGDEWIFDKCASPESFFPRERLLNDDFIDKAKMVAADGLLFCAVILFAISFFLIGQKMAEIAPYAIGCLVLIEILIFARSFRPTFDAGLLEPPEALKSVAAETGNARILNLYNPNIAMYLGTSDLWGDNPGLPRRYAEFMAFTQGADPNQASQYVAFKKAHPLFNMLRCGYFFTVSPQEKRMALSRNQNILPRVLLMQNYKVINQRGDIFSEMSKPEFNPSKMVILETEPQPRPVESNDRHTTKIIETSTDHIILEATLSSPAILLITDACSSGWRVKSLAESVQSTYTIMPANYILMAVPLEKGYHKLRIEYRPKTFMPGLLITAIAALLYFSALLIFKHKSKHAKY